MPANKRSSALTDIVESCGCSAVENVEQGTKQHTIELQIFKGYFQFVEASSVQGKSAIKTKQKNEEAMKLEFSFSLVLFIVLNLGLGIYILGWTPKYSRESDFLVAAYVSILFISSYLTQFFGKNFLFLPSSLLDPHLQVFLLLEYAVIIIGGSVAGVISLLLPKISSGISFGLLFSLMVLLGSQTYDPTTTSTDDSTHLWITHQTLIILLLVVLGTALTHMMEVRPLF
jgi:hypothetical protein